MAESRIINIVVNHIKTNSAILRQVDAICGDINGVEVGIHHSIGDATGFTCSHLYYGLAICKNQPDEEAAYEVAKTKLADQSLGLAKEESIKVYENLLSKNNIKFPVND